MPSASSTRGIFNFEWHVDKDVYNRDKHGICFECGAHFWAETTDGKYSISHKLSSSNKKREEVRYVATVSGTFEMEENKFTLKITYTLRDEVIRFISCIATKGKQTTGIIGFCDQDLCT
jgi:uncharacterized DUF497 family protein